MMECRRVNSKDIESIEEYFKQLSPETESYFAPHAFDINTIASICHENHHDYRAFICSTNNSVAAYFVVKKSLSEEEANRFSKYPIRRSKESDYVLAPSVADAFQSQGIGSTLFSHVETELRKLGAEKIILWGGVQLRNQRAVRFYLKNGFRTLGEFHHNDLDNLDMVKYLDDL
ncbi:MAG: GNAT family N-acetyltransferase [Bacteroidota bacterium]